MQDEWGYSELVVHPPPLNFLTIFIFPFALRKQWMKYLKKEIKSVESIIT